MSISRYQRTVEQDIACGLTPHVQEGLYTVKSTTGAIVLIITMAHAGTTEVPEPPKPESGEKEILSFPGHCPDCGASGKTNMVVTNIFYNILLNNPSQLISTEVHFYFDFQSNIPYFKEIILMAFTCDECGYKSNEIKCGGAISEKGKRISLKITMPEDLSRDVLKVCQTFGI